MKKRKPPRPKFVVESKNTVDDEIDYTVLNDLGGFSIQDDMKSSMGATSSSNGESSSFASSCCSPLDNVRRKGQRRKGKTVVSSGLITSTIGKRYSSGGGKSNINQECVSSNFNVSQLSVKYGASSSQETDSRPVQFSEYSYAEVVKSSVSKQLPLEKSTYGPCEEVLESLFSQEGGRNKAGHSTDWHTTLRNMESAMRAYQPPAVVQVTKPPSVGNEYECYHHPAVQYRGAMTRCNDQATIAHAAGNYTSASQLSYDARHFAEYARLAESEAKRQIFYARNKDIKNTMTIDLHGQHIEDGLRLLRLHLLFGTIIKFVRTFKVITGYGKHTGGKSVLKTSVRQLLDKEGIKWTEVNPGTLLVELRDDQQLSFLTSGNESE